MRKFLAAGLFALLILGAFGIAITHGQQSQLPVGVNSTARQGGTFYAAAYGTWGARIVSGNTSTGASTSITVTLPGPLGDNSSPASPPMLLSGALNPIRIADNNAETVTPTAISFGTCPSGNIGFGTQGCATITGTFNNTHGASASPIVISGTFGLQEAINVANASGGGIVVVDSAWTQMGGTSAMISAAVVAPVVSIEDVRSGTPRYWNITPTGLAMAAPTLPAINIAGQAACDTTHQMCSDATVAGSASWGGTVFACWAYVDIMGNEGPCSATTSWTSVASKAIDLGIPAASPGAVGAVPYLSLSGGTYAAAYQIPVTASVCTVTTLETVTPACAVANTTYGQAGSTFGAAGLFTTGGAQITTYPVNTSVHFTSLASTVQTTASYTPMTNSSVTYAYAPSNRIAACPGISSYNNVQGIAAGGISASSTAAIPMALATWTVPASCFNYIGAEFRVSGKFTWTEGGTSAATYNVVVGWDANGTDTTTKATALCTIANTHTPAAAAQNGYYSCTVKTLTTGATGTALVNGWGDMSIATGQALLIGFANDTAVAASASINLTSAARITVQFFDSGNTVTGAQGLENTLEFLN